MTTIMKGKEVAIALKEKIKAGVAELKEMELNDLIYNTNSNVRNLFSIED